LIFLHLIFAGARKFQSQTGNRFNILNKQSMIGTNLAFYDLSMQRNGLNTPVSLRDMQGMVFKQVPVKEPAPTTD
jgi:hypothetical protein